MLKRRFVSNIRPVFKLTPEKTEVVSRIIRHAIDAGLIKLADPDVTSPRYRSYIPFWA